MYSPIVPTGQNLALIALALAGFGCVSPLPNGVAAHPQSLLPSQDTTTTPLGYLELEAIGLWADSEQTTTAVIRYGLADRTEVYLLQELHRTLTDPTGPDPSGLGDAWIGLRHRIIDEDSSGVAHAFAAEVRLPHGDADKGLGEGELELHIAYIRDGTLGGFGWTTNSDLRILGDSGGRPDPALGGSVTFTTPLIRIGGRTLPLAFLAETGGLWHPEEDDSPAWIALGIRIPIHASLELQVAWMDGIGGDGPDERWIADLGRLVGDAIHLGTR